MKFSFWAANWTRPFEAPQSLYQKYAWVNNASSDEYDLLARPGKYSDSEHRHLEARLFGAMQKQYRAPHIELWNAADFPNAVCRICLINGFWSELPQIAGQDKCPLHGIVLQRHCRNCLRPLRFGCPRKDSFGAFVCHACGASIVPFSANSWLQWGRLPESKILSHFAHSATKARWVASVCEGAWHFPCGTETLDRKLILQALTGHPLIHEPNRNWSAARDEKVERVISTVFMLPCNETILDNELMGLHCALVSDVTKHCRQAGLLQSNTGVNRAVGLNRKMEELVFFTGGVLLDNVMTIQKALLEKNIWDLTPGYSTWHMENIIRCAWDPSYDAIPCSNKIPKILLSLATWQVVRILLLIESLVIRLTAFYVDKDSVDDWELRKQIHHARAYGVRLISGRSGDGVFIFNIKSHSWIPPYRMRSTIDGIELTVYQIVPEIEGKIYNY